MKKKRYGLRKKLLISITAISLIPGIFGVSAIYLTSKYTLLNSSSQRLELLAKNKSLILSSAISEEIIRQRMILREVGPDATNKIKERTAQYSNKTQKQIVDEIKKSLQANSLETIKLNNAQLAQRYIDISIYDTKGILVARMAENNDELIVNKADWFKNSIADISATTLVSEPFAHQSKTNATRFSFPIYDQQNKNIGVFTAILRSDDLFSKTLEVPPSEEAGLTISIYSNNGTLILAKDQSLHKLALSKPIANKLLLSESGNIISADEFNKQAIFGFAKVGMDTTNLNSLSFSGKQLYLVTKRSVATTVSPIILIVGSGILPGLTAGMVLIFIASIAISQFINPIIQLKKGADLIGHGNLNYRIRIKTGDEIEALCDSFNSMAENLKSSDQKLRMQAEKLQIRNEQLEQVNRLNNIKSEFLANTSHELRTPLNSIIGFSEILSDQTFGKLNEKQARYIENIKTSGRHLLDLINGILDLSKVEAGKMELHLEEIDLDTFLSDVEVIISPLIAKKQLLFTVNKDENLPIIQADSGKLKQIMYNLLSNAVKFTPAGGSISVTMIPRDKVVEIAVSDTGIGIGQEERSIIFQEFKQGEDLQSIEFKGTGLGLALTKQLVEMHGGKIWVESEPDKGSTFTFVIPVETDLEIDLKEFPSKTKQADAGIKVEKDNKTKRSDILIEESKNHLFALVKKKLKNKKMDEFAGKINYPVHFISDVEEILIKAAQFAPFALILDTDLIIKNGWGYINQIQDNIQITDTTIIITPINTKGGFGIPIIALDYIVKPINKNRLMSVLRSCGLTPAGKNEPITVLIADQNQISLDFIAKIFETEGFGVIKTGPDKNIIGLLCEMRPDLVVMDLIISKDITAFDIIQALPAHKTIKNIPYILTYEKNITQNDVERLNKSLSRSAKKDMAVAQFADEIFKLEELRPGQAGFMDKSTGMLNLNFAKRKIKQLAYEADIDKRTFSVILINIQPEPTNPIDTNNLKKIGSVLLQTTRSKDKIIHVNSNTFLVILDKTPKMLAEKMAQKTLKELNRHENLPDPHLIYNINIDIWTYFDNAATGEELLERLLIRIKSL